jgi:LPS export ABC transporter protein LptC
LLVLAALVQWLTMRQTLRERASDPAYGPANVLRLTHAIMHQTEGNALRVQVWADQAVYEEHRAATRLSNVRFTAYPRPERDMRPEPIEGVAAEAVVRGNESVLVLIGRVHITQGAHTELRGERLVYDYGQGLITSADPVWIRHEATVHEGTSLFYSIPEERIRLTRPLIWE